MLGPTGRLRTEDADTISYSLTKTETDRNGIPADYGL